MLGFRVALLGHLDDFFVKSLARVLLSITLNPVDLFGCGDRKSIFEFHHFVEFVSGHLLAKSDFAFFILAGIMEDDVFDHAIYFLAGNGLHVTVQNQFFVLVQPVIFAIGALVIGLISCLYLLKLLQIVLALGNALSGYFTTRMSNDYLVAVTT